MRTVYISIWDLRGIVQSALARISRLLFVISNPSTLTIGDFSLSYVVLAVKIHRRYVLQNHIQSSVACRHSNQLKPPWICVVMLLILAEVCRAILELISQDRND
jgi:hypothetical protein